MTNKAGLRVDSVLIYEKLISLLDDKQTLGINEKKQLKNTIISIHNCIKYIERSSV